MAPIKGIDISNFQPRVDWDRVKADGIAFVFLKATEGVGFVDPRYTAHVAGAKGVGIPCGAYHFARPDTESGGPLQNTVRDAQAEADAFLAVAQPGKGDLLPVLDLETPGPKPDRMVAWTQAWLDRVEARVGAKPIIYVSPGFWSRLGNTTAFGAYPLWIAHYGVATPLLPAGFSAYTIWQSTSKGSVPGIAGNVDMDQLGAGVKVADIKLKPAKAAAAVPVVEPADQNLPGPVPKPPWFWPWLRWHLGTGEFEGVGRNKTLRPDEAPAQIPVWARSCLEKIKAAKESA